MNDPMISLFNSEELTFDIQFIGEFDQSYQTAGHQILSTPQNINDSDNISEDEMETFKVRLFLSSGEDSTVIHDFSIGTFPTDAKAWKVEFEYVDQDDNIVHKTGTKTIQKEGDASPRPTTFNNVS